MFNSIVAFSSFHRKPFRREPGYSSSPLVSCEFCKNRARDHGGDISLMARERAVISFSAIEISMRSPALRRRGTSDSVHCPGCSTAMEQAWNTPSQLIPESV